MAESHTPRAPDESDLLEAAEEARRARQHALAVPCLWPKKRPRYLVEVRLRDTGERFECVGFDITKLGRGDPIGSRVMRNIPAGALIAEATHRLLSSRIQAAENVLTEAPPVVHHFHGSADGTVELVGEEPADDEFMSAKRAYWQARAAEARDRLEAASGEGTGRRYPPGHLEEVARVVRDARRRGEPTAAAVAEVFGIAKSAAANQISRARAQGLLDVEEDPLAMEGDT